MSGVVINRRMTFIARVERRAGALNIAEAAALLALYASYDRLAMRAFYARSAGFRLTRLHTFIGGVARPFLAFRKAA